MENKTMVDLSKYAGSRFLKLADVANGPKRKVIADVTEGDYDKPVLVFKDGSRFSVNKTNVNTLLELFGSADSKYIIGKEIVLYAGRVHFQGNETSSVLIRGVETEPDADPDHPAVAAPFSDGISDEIPF
jgi:hypothetical protein